MNLDAFVTALRSRIEEEQLRAVTSVISGTLDPKQYGYSCGYLKALDDIAKLRGKDDEGGIIDQILHDMRKE